MKVEKLTPLGYCHGVLRAINITKKAIETCKKPIYILGSIIHNKHIVEEFEKLGCITIENKLQTREQLLDLIDSGTVVFTAHGVTPNVYKKAIDKGLEVVDATCNDVIKIHKSYINYLSKGYTCLYIGQKNHPEVEGILGISPEIKLVTSTEEINNINSDKIYISNQTTLSYDDVKNIYDYAKNKYPHIIIEDERCNATTNRQNALKDNKSELCYIIGDNNSSNTKKLLTVSSKYTSSIMIETVMDIRIDDIIDKTYITITAGASTPKEIINDVYNYLSQFDKNKKETYENRFPSKIIL